MNLSPTTSPSPGHFVRAKKIIIEKAGQNSWGRKRELPQKKQPLANQTTKSICGKAVWMMNKWKQKRRIQLLFFFQHVKSTRKCFYKLKT